MIIDRELTRSTPSRRRARASALLEPVPHARAAERAGLWPRRRCILANPHPQGDRLYRYYVSQTVLKHGAGSCPWAACRRANRAAVIDQLRAVPLPEIVAGTWKGAGTGRRHHRGRRPRGSDQA